MRTTPRLARKRRRTLGHHHAGALAPPVPSDGGLFPAGVHPLWLERAGAVPAATPYAIYVTPDSSRAVRLPFMHCMRVEADGPPASAQHPFDATQSFFVKFISK